MTEKNLVKAVASEPTKGFQPKFSSDCQLRTSTKEKSTTVNAVVTCEIKLLQNYFSLRRRPSEIIIASTLRPTHDRHASNNFNNISKYFYFTCNHGIRKLIDLSMKFSRVYVLLLLTGSPFTIPVIDGRKASVTGECVGGVVMANKPCSFDVNTRMVGADAPLYCTITCKMLSHHAVFASLEPYRRRVFRLSVHACVHVCVAKDCERDIS